MTKKTGPGDIQPLPNVPAGSSWAQSSSEFLNTCLYKNAEKTTSNYSLSGFIPGLFDTFRAVSPPLDSHTTVSASCRTTSSPLTLQAGTLCADVDRGVGGVLIDARSVSSFWCVSDTSRNKGAWCSPPPQFMTEPPTSPPPHPPTLLPHPPVIARGLRFDMRQPTVSLLNV